MTARDFVRPHWPAIAILITAFAIGFGLVPTAGSVESVAMLLDPHSEVSVGLVQGGTIGAQGQSELQSLGTLFYEPYWWFRRRDIQGVGVPSLRGRQSIGRARATPSSE
jgi:hypothetical protein